jgi:DMSO/TMAO reductase YedYZ molybdopterin-dependent catalytic subunit
MLDRRQILQALGKGAIALGAAGAGGVLLPRSGRSAEAPPSSAPTYPDLPFGARQEAVLDALPGKASLIKLSYRPPNYETPLSYFRSPITPNNAFFVRYHLAVIPEINPAAWRLKIGGEAVSQPFELSLDQLKREFEPVELVAVCQCSGNRRGLVKPHVPGVQWGYGAMGAARWKGARLKDILNRAGLKKEALELVLDGADSAVIDKTPDFVKSLPIWKALDENSIIAYEMNGEPLPHFNGFPARLVVPGWTAVYWTKHVVSLTAITKPFDGFWMAKAYRLPRNTFPVASWFASQENDAGGPIAEILVNSLITNLTDGQKVPAGKPLTVEGLAWDGGYGVREVETSLDGGQSWRAATLDEDLGRFAFRRWSFTFTPEKPGASTIMARASNRIGQTQTAELIVNPAGYHHNVIQRVAVDVSDMS